MRFRRPGLYGRGGALPVTFFATRRSPEPSHASENRRVPRHSRMAPSLRRRNVKPHERKTEACRVNGPRPTPASNDTRTGRFEAAIETASVAASELDETFESPRRRSTDPGAEASLIL